MVSPTLASSLAFIAVIAFVSIVTIGAVVPLSGALETKMLPPPPMFLVVTSFLLAVLIAFSFTGLHLARLPLAALIGFQASRLPLELILHNW